MKKFTAALLIAAMTIGMTVSAAATETIVIENNVTEQKTEEQTKEPVVQAAPTATPTPEPTAAPTPAPTAAPSPDTTPTPTPTAAPTPTAGATADTAVQSDKAVTVTSNKTYLALGADLTASQRSTVLALMGIAEADLPNYDVVYVTNAEEHQRLDTYIASSVIGTKSLSSVVVRPADKGHGVTVTTKNINYCTDNMYRNALITAGVEDADIMVVGPSPISGTAALIGALKAYERM